MSSNAASSAAEALFQQGRSLHRSGDLVGARRQYGQALLLEPDHAEAMHGLGVVEFKSANFARAVELISAAIRQKPAFGNAHFNLGNVYRAMGQLESSRQSYQTAVSLMPDDAQAHVNLGVVLAAMGVPDQAVTAFENAVLLDPRYTEAHANLGFALLDAGRIDAAAISFRKCLELGPADPEIVRSLAECEGRLGHYFEAAQNYRALLQILPDDVPAHQRLALALEARDRLEEAIDVLDRAVGLAPGDLACLMGRASVSCKLKRYEDALRDYDAILQVDRSYPGALLERGRCLLAADRFDEALESLDAAISKSPPNALSLAARGDALRCLGRQDEAIAAYRAALQIDDHLAEVHNNLAVVLRQQDRFEEALVEFQGALRLKPDFAVAETNRGGLLRDLRRLDEAEASLLAAVALDPGLAVAHRTLGDVYRIQGQPDQALVALDRATTLDPLDAEAHMIYGHTLFDKSRFVDAVACYDRALALNPELEFLWGLRLFTKLYVCQWREFEKERADLLDRIGRQELACAPFASLVLFDSLATVEEIARIFSNSRFKKIAPPPRLGAFTKHTKIKIGYFSADFFEHATTHLMIDLFEKHDRDAFELIAISFGPDIRDAMRLRLESAFDQFHDVRNRSDEQIVQLARQLEIDIAVDLKGYTANYRPAIFALRAAPVQVSYLGYPGTLQMAAMDYLIADPVLVPKESRAFYSEKIAYLPNTYQPNDTGRRISEKRFTRSELGLPESAFVFCCFNNNFKLLPGMFDCWMKILLAAPDSVLWLLGDNDVVIQNLRQEAQDRGVDGERMVFAKRLPSAEHLARHFAADLFLDVLPYNAHTTASDALWTGLPVLTLAGESFASRVAASLLHAVQLPELVTYNEDDYVASAVALSRDRDRIARIKHHLQLNRHSLPLFDIVRFTSDLESLFQRMHDAALKGLVPDHLEGHAAGTPA